VSLEAQACGCPVVVADEGGLPETLVDGVTGWRVQRNDATATARRLEQLEDTLLRARMSAAAAAHGSASSWRASASVVARCIRSVQEETIG
jgi:glycosyltransferase involved in cell wall biosynthesis